MRRAALAVCLAAGCAAGPGARPHSIGVSYRTHIRSAVYEDGSLSPWGADVGLGRIDPGGGLPIEAAYFVYWDRHGEFLQGVYCATDLAPPLVSTLASARRRGAARGLHGKARVFATLAPFAGLWHWVESPHNLGLLAGARVGAGWRSGGDGPGAELRLEYGALWLNDTLDDGDTRLRFVTLRAAASR